MNDLKGWNDHLRNILPPEAFEFVIAYVELVNKVDDIIDEEVNSEFILETFDLAANIYSSSFYITHKSILHGIDKMINNMYADSVLWERGKMEKQSRILKLAGVEMVMAVIRICCGRAKARAMSPLLREFMFNFHPENIGVHQIDIRDKEVNHA